MAVELGELSRLGTSVCDQMQIVPLCEKGGGRAEAPPGSEEATLCACERESVRVSVRVLISCGALFREHSGRAMNDSEAENSDNF